MLLKKAVSSSLIKIPELFTVKIKKNAKLDRNSKMIKIVTTV